MTSSKPKFENRGNALMLVVLSTVVLAILARAITFSSTRRSLDSLKYVQGMRSELLADAAVQWVLDQLDRDPDFAQSQKSVSLQSMPGEFSIDFASTDESEVGPEQSVNNLRGLTATNGPRGELTVAPGTFDLVVMVSVDGFETRYETLIRQPQLDIVLPAMQGAGRIQLRGHFSVSGLDSLSSDVEVPGNLHSSSEDPSAMQLLAWQENSPADMPWISGKATTSSPSTEAFDLTGVQIDWGTMSGVPTAQREPPLIMARIASHSGAASFAPSPSGTSVAAEGDFYVPNDLDIAGDLRLDDAELFVNGDLSVDGSIFGNGTIWVKGNTLFYGDPTIRSQPNASVSVFSHGNVELRGFKGRQFLEHHVQSSGDANLEKAWTDTKTALRGLQTAMAGMVGSDLKQGEAGDKSTQAYRAVLGGTGLGSSVTRPTGMQSDTLGTLREALSQIEPSPARDFMRKRLDFLQKFFQIKQSQDAAMSVSELLSGSGDATASWDDFSKLPSHLSPELREQALAVLRNKIREMALDKLGASSFSGTIVTDGAFLTEGEVSILGQVWATGSNKMVPSLSTQSGLELQPGDLGMDDHCHITYCHVFAESSRNRYGGGGWKAEVWFP